MKHTEYGLKFVISKEFGFREKTADPINGEADELCYFIDSLYYSGFMDSIDDSIISPLNDLILGNIDFMDEVETDSGSIAEFTPTIVILKSGETVKQSIPSEDFRQIIIEWRDFMNAPIEKDWRSRAPFKWFRLFE